ncbi:MAG TPA: alpha/beta hydrolase [Alphaproteobacteria bacterium]|jgi:pimeloyl-ACP methyl ester carboxylesterase
MTADVKTKPQDRYVTVDGLKMRYIEEGQGPALVMLHGASLGSSADVFIRNLGPLAKAGFRAIAFDVPGFGLTDVPEDASPAFRRKIVPKFIDALGLKKVALIGHSQAGGTAVQLALQEPERYSHVVILGTGSLLPPLDEKKDDSREGAVQQRLERRMAAAEPTIDDTRKLLEANLYHHELITPDELALRHSRSIGPAFRAFVMRNELAESGKAKAKTDEKPLWQKTVDLQMPVLMIYGKNDRANANERALLLKKTYPQLDLHIVDDCKHLVPWDAADEFIRLAVPFLKKTA